MKKFINLIPVICLTAWLGCGGGGGDTKSKGVIAYSPLTLSNPFFKVIGDHIKAEAEKNGYTVRIVDPNMDVKKQSDQMDDFIASGVTAITAELTSYRHAGRAALGAWPSAAHVWHL